MALTVRNDIPRVIWVPNEFERIQDAIGASEDGDTIIVRADEYHGQLPFFAKNVSFISESGPELTIIDGTGFYTGAWITGGQDTTMTVRGFTFQNNSDFQCYGAFFSGANPRIVNNIFISNRDDIIDERRGFLIGKNAAIIRNNLFIHLRNGMEISHSWGDVSNNMFLDIYRVMWNGAGHGQPLIPDYNLAWEYTIVGFSVWGEHNIMDQEPLFEDDSYILREDSPGFNQGRPDIKDLDGSRSDIGVHGGPQAYTHP